MKITVMGLGYIGLPTAITLAEAGFEVCGFDVNKKTIETLQGGNLTPIGASANIAAIGILRKQGEQVRTRDFLRIGIPFTLAAVLTGYVYLWLVWGA